MASINKLSVRGVRSFSPDDAEQVLEFYFPCTIIVGANGCGKTTIIESLKFAVSGSLPPGNKSGQAFVHDPRSIGQSSVKANIKLRFTGRAGNSMVVVRSMEVQQKKTTMSFKQLDGVLRSTDKDGNRVSLGHKCSELDRQLPLLLGVSRAILDHVIFCHQEDSSWPLQEGAVLKKRFDEIFDSTRYTKALDVFAKLKKEYMGKVKDLKADVAGFSSHRHAAKGFRQEMTKHNEQMDDVEEEITENRKGLKEVQEEQSRLDQIMEQVDEINNDVESRKNELTTKLQVVKKQKSMLQENLTQQHSVRELKEMLRDFDSQMGNQLEKKSDLEAELSAAEKELLRIQKQETDLRSRMGRLEGEKEAHEKCLQQRFEKMVGMGDTYALGDALTAITQSQSTQTQNTSYTNTNASALDLSTSGNGRFEGEAVLDIPEKDMEEFYRAVANKEEELKEALEHHRQKHTQQEDQLQSQISDIMAKLKSIESTRESLNKKQNDARKELQQISEKLKSTHRLRKSDIEDTRREAARLAKDRDDANKDERRGQIPTEIRNLEIKADQLKREIEDDRIALEYLRQTADRQNAIVVLKDQCIKDMELLEETMTESSYVAQQFNIKLPKELPGKEGGDEDGDELTTAINTIVDDISNKHEARNLEVERTNAELAKLQQAVSERTALLSHDHRAIKAKRNRMLELEGEGGAIEIVKDVMTELLAHESQLGLSSPKDLSEARPQELAEYLHDRLVEKESQSTEGIPNEAVKKIITRLLNQARQADDKFACPCCTRDFEAEKDFLNFKKQMKVLVSEASPLLQLDQANKSAISKYTSWKTFVTENTLQILEYRRIANEVNDLETNIRDLEAGLSESNKQLKEVKETASDFESQVSGLRDLLDSSRRWAESASRIAEKRMQVSQKEEDLHSAAADTKGRDLRKVERELNDRTDQREQHTNQINKFNKEMSALNNRISQLSGQASRMEQVVRDKEKKMAEVERLSQRKSELSDIISNCASEEKKLQEEIAPLRQKNKSKETEKTRMRALNREEEERLSTTVNSFIGVVKELKDLGRRIEEYLASSTEEELATFERKTADFEGKANNKFTEIQQLKPDLDRLIKAVDDQERHKKNLKENIELINSKERIDELKKEVGSLEEKAATVEGHETVIEDIESLRSRKEGTMKSTARLEGRRGEILESIRSIKRKLSQEEYKNVDEEHRVAMIKWETTQMAVKDLEKYHTALDKALLRFHSLKIGEINTIIRDLWNLTYKGEDINNIEIVSGQDSGSRATRSYNYRVVMTKGSTQLDMRGRCSAGQRVLASIVIRLALAETFCLNFGCIALDEPTVNLDYNNKKGLAIALAQIIASRAQQSNFQLVLITHDEDFVGMMKTELSSQTGFQMPEKYFQVRREEGADGKFYSKIDAIDWDELI